MMDRTDEKILSLIEKRTVSGEEIAKILGVSRVAVWKRIKKLETLGYTIKRYKEGYKLGASPDFLYPYELKKYLKTKWLGRKYIFFEEIDSTNIYAKKENLEHGTVVLAETQTKGKGRKGRKWVSQKGKGLYFSIVLKKSYPFEQFSVLSLLFPVAVKKAIQKHISKQIFIKWPNDLYIEGKKFAGFLIETELEGSEISKIVAGIGVNVNNTTENLKGIPTPATSLRIEEGKKLNRKQILADILLEIENQIESFSHEKVVDEVEKSLLWKGKEVIVVDNHKRGTLLGINKKGYLILQTDRGLEEIVSGDLSLRQV